MNILREQDLWESGRLQTGSIKKLGKLLGVDALIVGTVTRYSPDSKDRVYLKDGQGKLREEIFIVGAEIGINARMIDVETGTVIWAGAYTYESYYMDTAIKHTVSALLNSLKKVWPVIKRD